MQPTLPPTALLSLLAVLPVVGALLLGIQLKPAFFRAVVTRPRALLVGLASQMLLIPLLAVVFFYATPAPLSVKAGAFVLAAMPGGQLSNLLTFLGRGELPLSVVLTGCSTVASIVTIPLWLSVGLHVWAMDAAHPLALGPVALRSFAILVVPLGIGVAIGVWKPDLAGRIERPTRRAMLVLALAIVSLYLSIRWQAIVAYFSPAVVASVVAFHMAAVLGGWGLARSFALGRPKSFTIGIETGTQNVAMALVVLEMLGEPVLLPFVGYYAVATLTMALLWVPLLGGRRQLVMEPGPVSRPSPAR